MPNLIFVIGLLIFLAASFRISFFYFVLYFFALAWLFARLWVWRAWRSLEISRQFDDHVFLGETATLRLKLTNNGRLPIPWIRVEDKLPQRLTGTRASAIGRGDLASPDAFRAVVSLLPRETRTLEYHVTGSRRGYYPIGPMSILLGDVFGLYTRSMATATPSYLTVYPKIVPIEQLGLPSKIALGTLSTHQILYEDPARVVGVRDYSPGDSLRKVNWKVTASLGKLQVKKLEPAITLETLIFLNLNLEEYDLGYSEGASELAITTAASIASHLAGLRQPIGLISNGRDRGIPETEEPLTEPDVPRGLSARLPWELDRRGVDELGFATPDSIPLREKPSIALPSGKGRTHLMRVLETLARAQLRSGQPLASLLRQQAVRLPWGSTVIVITFGRAMGLTEALIGLRKSGFNVVVLLVRFGMRDTYPAELAALGLQVHEVRSEQDTRLLDEARVAV